MPELPEVQIQVNQLQRLRGRRIAGVRSRDPKIKLPRSLVGQRIAGISRRGKHIIVRLSGGRFLLAHLRMTGWFEFVEPARWRAMIITDGGSVYFADSRRFGMLRVVTHRGLERELAGLGPEPLAHGFRLDGLAQTGRAIKVALLDQRLVAGIGNIYANEALWRARIDPRRPANRLRPLEAGRLRRGIVAALRKGLAYGPRIFEVQEFCVYDRAGKPCRRCRTRIRRVMLAQRSTYYCPRCQR